ncbi:MAG: hypothetical protein ABIR70_06785 [Bryobacteraceae bacterium]
MQDERQSRMAYSRVLQGNVGDFGHTHEDLDDRRIELHVIFTQVPGTLRALEEATTLAKDLNARVRLLVPQVVPYPLDLKSPPVLVEFNESRFLAMARAQSVETDVQIYLCRDAEALLIEKLSSPSIVIIGGLRRWWPTRETRLARKLRQKGHHVVFAELREAAHA